MKPSGQPRALFIKIFLHKNLIVILLAFCEVAGKSGHSPLVNLVNVYIGQATYFIFAVLIGQFIRGISLKFSDFNF